MIGDCLMMGGIALVGKKFEETGLLMSIVSLKRK